LRVHLYTQGKQDKVLCPASLHTETCPCTYSSCLQRQKQHLRDEQQHASQEREALRNQVRALRDRLPRRVAADGGDAELRDLEFRLAHETNQAPEEKTMQARVKELAAARPALRELAQLEAKLKDNNDSRDGLSGRLQQLNTQLDGISATLEAEKQSVEAQKSSQAIPDQSILNAEKQEVGRRGGTHGWGSVSF